MKTRDELNDAGVGLFGPYEVGERLGVGGMAEVHRAVKRGAAGFERACALKRMRPALTQNRRFVDAFIHEARLTATLRHPNIRTIFELGSVDGVYYIDMELIDGVDLSKLLRRARRTYGPPPFPLAVFILDQICDALHYIHNWRIERDLPVGIVHRDISPGNVMICGSGHVKLIDFGIAESALQASSATSKQVKGKLGYLSPEAFTGGAIDIRSDLFSVGVIAHELLTVHRLFRQRSDEKSIRRIHAGDLPKPSDINANVPSILDAWVMRALQPLPEERWPSAVEMRSDLAAIRRRLGMFSNHEVASWVDDLYASPSGKLELSLGATTPQLIDHEDRSTNTADDDSVSSGVVTVVDDPASSGVITVVDEMDCTDTKPVSVPRGETAPLPRRRAARGSEVSMRAHDAAATPRFSAAIHARPREHERLVTVRASQPGARPTASGRAQSATAVMALDDQQVLLSITASEPASNRRTPAIEVAHNTAQVVRLSDEDERTASQNTTSSISVATYVSRRLLVVVVSAIAAGVLGVTVYRHLSPRSKAPPRARVVAPMATPPADAGQRPSAPLQVGVAPDQSAAPTPPAPPVTMADPPASDAPVAPRKLAWNRRPMVAVAEVDRIAGALLDLPRDYHATLCIDETGRVFAMRFDDASRERAKELRRTLRRWRYSPYVLAGRPAEVCFRVTLERHAAR